ncbi:MAG TPA: DedA family protein [Nocardioidaceae bacterium]|nr:DedA family protein [Nocardioidaceae bacterium]
MSLQDGRELDGVAGWAVDLMETLGGPGAGIAIALENLFPPLPSEVILPLAGFTASRGDMSLASAIVWTTLGSLVGALVLYYLGALLGRRRMRLIAVRMPLIHVEDVDKAEAWFVRHGNKAVFFGRMIPLFRSFISIPAGIERMRLPVFMLYTTLGSLLWNVIFVLAGYGLGENWHLVEQYAASVKSVVVIVVLFAVGWFIIHRLVRQGLARRRG